MGRHSRQKESKAGLIAAAVVLAIVALVCLGLALYLQLKPEPDPHEGQVYINDGFGMVWMTPLEGVPVNQIQRDQIRVIDGRPEYVGSDHEVRYGIDVSEHQMAIDWAQVKKSGVDFAMIRLGRRGYTEGGIFKDPWFQQNMEGAAANGIDLGVYFFSQAITPEEAAEEADFVLEHLKGYDISMPVVYDWEKIEGAADARTNGLDETVLTDCAVAFCEKIRAAGYEPCVYYNRHLGYYGFDLQRLTEYKSWIALPGTFPDFYYAFDMWQYSFSAQIPGIEGPTDVNMYFIPKAPLSPSPSPTA